MNTFMVEIGCVDGVTGYTIETDDKEVALGFLERYDHEGSTVIMRLRPGPDGEWLDAGETYKFLTTDAE